MTSYVGEVQHVIDEGVPEEIAIELYNVLTEKFEKMYRSPPETEYLREDVASLRKNERRTFRDIIDETCARYPLPVDITWRELKYVPERITRCEVCMRYFYDVSRNGRRLTCSEECNRNYRNYTRTGGTVMDPIYSRNVQEVPIDFSPASDDEVGNAMLDEVEMTRQRRLDGQTAEFYRKLYRF